MSAGKVTQMIFSSHEVNIYVVPSQVVMKPGKVLHYLVPIHDLGIFRKLVSGCELVQADVECCIVYY